MKPAHLLAFVAGLPIGIVVMLFIYRRRLTRG